MRTGMTVVASLAAVLLAAGGAKAQVRYEVTDLGTFGGIYVRNKATAISSNGTIAGHSLNSVGQYSVGWLYHNGVMVDIGNLGQNRTHVYDVNDSGMVVGSSLQADEYSERAFTYINGVIAPLYESPGKLCYDAEAVNNSGQVTGLGYYGEAFVYHDGQFQNIEPSWVRYSVGYAINERGDVAGDYDTWEEGYNHAFAYIDGCWISLGSGGDISTVYGINDVGDVVGVANTRAFLYREGVMQDLGTLGGDTSAALAINNSGTIIGCSKTGPTGPDEPFVWSNGVMYRLQDLVDGWYVDEVMDINDRGQIVGSANNHAILLTPIPEPAALSLLCVGLAALVTARRNRKPSGS